MIFTDENSGNVITLHFDVPGHAITTDQFLDNIIGTRRIINELNKLLFEKKAKIKTEISSPSRGSFSVDLSIDSYLVAAAACWAFIESKRGSAFIEGLTGRHPDQIAKNIGVATSAAISEISDQLANKVSAAIIRICTIQILINENQKLFELGLGVENLDEVLAGKNQFYQACLENDEVKAVGFDSSENFPVKREDFSHHITPPSERIESKSRLADRSHYECESEIAEISIFQLNWKSRQKKSGYWSAVFGSDDQVVRFTIDDDEFWKKIERNLLDKIRVGSVNAKVQWCFERSYHKRTNVKVIKVLEFDGQLLAKPLAEKEVMEVYGPVSDRNEFESKQQGLPFE